MKDYSNKQGTLRKCALGATIGAMSFLSSGCLNDTGSFFVDLARDYRMSNASRELELERKLNSYNSSRDSSKEQAVSQGPDIGYRFSSNEEGGR